jgi:hypothetical protein
VPTREQQERIEDAWRRIEQEGATAELRNLYESYKRPGPHAVYETFESTIATSTIRQVFKELSSRFLLDQTALLEPDLACKVNVSIYHSHTENGFFNSLIQDNVTSYRFKFWSKENALDFVEARICPDRLLIEIHLPGEKVQEVRQFLREGIRQTHPI